MAGMLILISLSLIVDPAPFMSLSVPSGYLSGNRASQIMPCSPKMPFFALKVGRISPTLTFLILSTAPGSNHSRLSSSTGSNRSALMMAPPVMTASPSP